MPTSIARSATRSWALYELLAQSFVQMVTIVYDGAPMGKQRPRLGRGHVYTPKETVAFERALAWSAKIAMRGRAMLTGPLRIEVQATFAHDPTRKPDADNLFKGSSRFAAGRRLC